MLSLADLRRQQLQSPTGRIGSFYIYKVDPVTMALSRHLPGQMFQCYLREYPEVYPDGYDSEYKVYEED